MRCKKCGQIPGKWTPPNKSIKRDRAILRECKTCGACWMTEG